MIQDMLLTCCMVYTAERFIRVPNVINIYRVLGDSLSHKNEAAQDSFVRYLRALISGFNFLDKFLSAREFFLRNPQLKYLALETYFNEATIYLGKVYEVNPVHIMHNILQREFERGDCSSLTAFFFSALNVYRIALIREKERLKELEKIERHDKAYISELENFVANLLNKE